MSDAHARTSSRSRGPVPVIVRYTEDYSPSASSTKSSSRSRSKSHSSSSHTSSRHHSDRSSTSSTSSSKYGLTVLGAVPDMIPAGYPFQPSVMATKRRSTSSSHRSRSSSNLIAVATLVSASHSAPMPQGTLRGSNLVASFAELPSEYRARLPSDLKSTGLGYAAFPNMSVVHPGEYKLRISLLRLPSSSSRSRDTETMVSIETGKFHVYSHPQFRA